MIRKDKIMNKPIEKANIIIVIIALILLAVIAVFTGYKYMNAVVNDNVNDNQNITNELI